jgi:hypothetical protein
LDPVPWLNVIKVDPCSQRVVRQITCHSQATSFVFSVER